MGWLGNWLGDWIGGWLGSQSTSEPIELECALKALFDAHSGLGVLIGSNSFEIMLPQSPEYPCISYYRLTTTRLNSMGEDSHIVRAYISVAAWSPVSGEVKAVSEQVAACLRRYAGIVSSNGVTLKILDVYLRNQLDNFDSIARIFNNTMDFEVVYYEV